MRLIWEGASMKDNEELEIDERSVLQLAFEDEFNKIPRLFRFTEIKKKILKWFTIIWLAIDIIFGVFFSFVRERDPDKTFVPDAYRSIAINTDLTNIVVAVIFNVILVVALLWIVIGLAFEKRAFVKAGRIAAKHEEWERERNEKERQRIRAQYKDLM